MHFKCQTKIYKHAYEAYWSHGDKPHFTHENIGVSPVKVGLFSPGDLKLKPGFFLPNFPKSGFSNKNSKYKQHHRIYYVQIKLGT